MNRRGFLLGLGATIAAPAVVRVEWIMPVRKLWVPPNFITVDSLIIKETDNVVRTIEKAVGLLSKGGTIFLKPGTHYINNTVNLPSESKLLGNNSIIYFPSDAPIFDCSSNKGIEIYNCHFKGKGLKL